MQGSRKSQSLLQPREEQQRGTNSALVYAGVSTTGSV